MKKVKPKVKAEEAEEVARRSVCIHEWAHRVGDRREPRLTTSGPWVALAVVVAWGCVRWRSELVPVAYADDSSVHEQMVRFALGALPGRAPAP